MASIQSVQHPLGRLWRYGQNYRPQIWGAIANSILNTIFDLAPPYLIGIAIDVVVNNENSLIARVGITSISGQLTVLSLLTFLIWSLESLTEYIYASLWRNLAQNLQHDLRIDTYSHLQSQDLSYFEDRSTGSLLSILNDDINQMERFLDTGAHSLLRFLTTVIWVGTTFLVLAPRVSWMAMLPIPFVLWGSVAFQRRLAPRYAEVRNRAGLISGRLANNLSGIATIKSFTAEAYECDRVWQDSDAYRQSNRRAIALSAAFIPVIRIVILVGFTTMLYLGGMAVAGGTLSAGTYGFMVFIVQRLLWPFTQLSTIMDEYQRAMASVRRVLGVLDTPVELIPGHQPLPVEQVRGEVHFEQVSFAYANRQPVLRNLSLHIPAGQSIGVVGATGSGKSTLVKLLLRFYQPQQGRILIDGQEIQDLLPQDLRRCIGLARMCFCFRAPWRRTSPTAPLRPPPTRFSTPLSWRRPTSLLSSCPRATTRSWASGGRSSRGGSGNGWRSPAPFSKTRRFWCWMRRPRRWITRPRRLSSDRWWPLPKIGRPWRSPTACPRFATAIVFM